ncbi:hypothetical protein KC19_VG318500 [Ceratodon purpureus]|uniref:Uncharacterized protein n=1 Tax=Ceratodon purpureus TaxID=3225 RepID=A0A8T0HWM9_CERPU|nr:hypothetical protein KC19_VG318500 [Ceratodon purpureus]
MLSSSSLLQSAVGPRLNFERFIFSSETGIHEVIDDMLCTYFFSMFGDEMLTKARLVCSEIPLWLWPDISFI